MKQDELASWKSLDGVDWDMLHEQKAALVKLLFKEETLANVETHLEGILNLLDSVMDEASERGLFVFPGEDDSPGR